METNKPDVDERTQAVEELIAQIESAAAEGPEAVAELFETMAAYIRLALMTPDQWAELFQRALQEVTQETQQKEAEQSLEKKVEQPPPQEPQQEMKTESVRERIFSPRSASSRTRGKSLREILNL